MVFLVVALMVVVVVVEEDLQLRLHLLQLHQHINNVLRLLLDPPHEHLARRGVLDEANTDPRAPDAVLRIARVVDDLAPRARDEVPHVLELGAARPALERDDLFRDAVLVHARGVVEGAEDVDRVLFGGGDDLVFDVLVYRAGVKECVRNL